MRGLCADAGEAVARLPSRDRRVLDGLVRLAGDPPRPLSAGQRTLAARLDVSIATMERALAVLREAGLIASQRGGDGRPGTLTLHPDAARALAALRSRTAAAMMSTTGEPRALKVARLLAERAADDAALAEAGRQYLDIASEEEAARIRELAEGMQTEDLDCALFVDDPLANRAVAESMKAARRRVEQRVRLSAAELRKRFIRR
jgi:DNA-binding MarR family transcriptional regulator